MDDPRNSVKVNTLPYGRESVIGRSILFYASERKGVRRFRKVNERIIEDEENFFDLLFPFEPVRLVRSQRFVTKKREKENRGGILAYSFEYK